MADLIARGMANKALKQYSSHLADMAQQITNIDNTKASKTEVNNLATEKADKAYVDNLAASLASGSPNGVYATLSELQAAYPTGTTGIYVVTADGNWYYWDGTAWTAGGQYQSTGIANKSITSAKLADDVNVIINSPFTVYNANLVGILDIKIYNTDYQKFRLRYFWRNHNGFAAYIRIEGWDGSQWVNLDSYSSTTAPMSDIELLSVDSPYLKFDILIDWRLVPDPLNFSAPMEIKKSCIYYKTQKDTEILDTAKSLLPSEGYAVRDSITNIITVDANGSGDYTTIAEAYAAIIGSSISYNQYEVVIYPGIYHEKNLVTPPFTHTHGTQPNTVIVTSEGLGGGSDPVFEQRANTRLSNMTIISDTGYCVHFDHSNNKDCALVNENLYLKKITYGAIIGGGTRGNGALYIWRNCTFENGTAACHTSGSSVNWDNTRLVFENCKLVDASLGLSSTGGFGHVVCEIKGLKTIAGKESLVGSSSNMRTDEALDTYFANTTEWQIIGGGNENFLPNITIGGEGLMFETANVNESITLGGTALKDLFGSVKYRSGTSRMKGTAKGILMVKDAKAGLEPYTTLVDRYQMWHRLGDCSVNNKTLTVTVGGITQTYTFDQNYAALKPDESTLIEAINSVITIATLKKYVPTQWESINTEEKQYIRVTEADGVLEGEWLTPDGNICAENEEADNVYGVALENGAYGDVIPVWTGNVYPYTAADGEYGIGANGALSATATTKIGRVKNNVFIKR